MTVHLRNSKKTEEDKQHWAFQIAKQLRERGALTKECFRLQSSISPSGVIHIGNFRDTIIAWAVRRALALKKIEAEFILNFDDADGVKSKIIPEEEQKKPLSEALVNYQKISKKFSQLYLKELMELGIIPDRILYQAEAYFNSNRYTSLMNYALSRNKKIVKILNGHRNKKLSRDWNSLIIFCESCKKQIEEFYMTTQLSFPRKKHISYHCHHCGKNFTGTVHEISYKKMAWRIDWPMRCHYEKIDYEPCGIDHYVQGSTITTSEEILKKIFHSSMPLINPYEIVRLKNSNYKLSSSKGDSFNLSIYHNLYPREVILWFFLSRELMSPIVVNPAEDFFRCYSEFNRFIRHCRDNPENSKLRQLAGIIDIDPEKYLANISVRKLCFVSQIFENDLSLILSHFKRQHLNVSEQALLEELKIKLHRVTYWLDHFAPDKWRFTLTVPKNILTKHREAAKTIINWLQNPGTKLTIKDYQEYYEMLLNKPYGPRLRSILTYWNREKLLKHCSQIIANSEI